MTGNSLGLVEDDYHAGEDDVREYQNRFPVIYGVIVATFMILIFRLWYLQVMRGEDLERVSQQNQFKEEPIRAVRGLIKDRDGEVLVDNILALDVQVVPQYFTKIESSVHLLAPLLGKSEVEIKNKILGSRLANGQFRPVVLKENISRELVATIERLKVDVPGLSIKMAARRHYSLGENAAQVFGYTGEISREELTLNPKYKPQDLVGKTGLEKKWDHKLRGTDGSKFDFVDARGREITDSNKDLILGNFAENTEALPGGDLVLTLDKDIQTTAFEGMRRDQRVGSVVALDPRTGEILAMVNSPSFNPDDLTTGMSTEVWSKLALDPFRPMRNKAVQDYFPPASTFKAVIAIAALEEKIITEKSSFFCPGSFKFGARTFHCAKREGHGNVNVVDALEQSCDVYFYHLGLLLGVDRIAKYARRLGFGSKTGIDLDGERGGLIPDAAWKEKTLGEPWQPGENLTVTIGQGFVAATPLQVVTAYAAIGNGGFLTTPFILSPSNEFTKTGAEHFNDLSKKRFADDVTISRETLAIVKRGLSKVFNGSLGTARRFRIPNIEVAGKTGTAQVIQISAKNIYAPCEKRELRFRHNGWMVAFAPKDNPRIAVVVHAEHACHPAAAGPILRDVILAYFKKYPLDPPP